MDVRERHSTDTILILIASLAISFIIWYIAKQGDVETAYPYIPIEYSGVPAQIEAEMEPREVRVSLHYPKTSERWNDRSNFRLKVVLDNLARRAGVEEFKENVYQIYPSMVEANPGVPDSVRVLEIENPREVRVMARWRLVKAQLVSTTHGSPAENYVLEDVVLDPRELTLTGSKESIERWTDRATGKLVLRTDPIDLTERNTTFQSMARVQLPDGLTVFDMEKKAPREIREEVVSYTVKIGEETGTREIKDIPIRISTLSREVQIEVSPTVGKVTVSGPVRFFGQVRKEYIKFKPSAPLNETVDYSGEIAIDATWADTTPDEIKTGLKLVSSLPASVRVTLKVPVSVPAAIPGTTPVEPVIEGLVP